MLICTIISQITVVHFSNRIREDSDYDDEYVAQPEATEAQIKTAEELIELVEKYIKDKI